MLWRVRGFLCLGGFLLLVGAGCIDETPTGPATPRQFIPLNPGDRWTYQYVIDDSARYWNTVLRDEVVVLAGDTVYALDYFADGALTQSQYYSVDDGGRVYLAGSRRVSYSDTLVTVLEPHVRLSPQGTGPGESWREVAELRQLKISSSIPPDTLVTVLPYTWAARVLAEERVLVPAFDGPVSALLVEYYGDYDAWSPADFSSYFWFAEDVGPVRTIDLTIGGRTVSDLSEYVRGT